MSNQKTIFVAGHRGMLGSSIVRNLQMNGHKPENILTADRAELDLCDQTAVNNFLNANNIDEIYIAAAKVGGIKANATFPAEFIYENLMIQTNLINGALNAGIKKLLAVGSTCIFPKYAPQPMNEKSLLCGPLEPTNEAYALAKIVGLKMCEFYTKQYKKTHGISFRGVMPTNLFGPNDTYDLENSHVIPALIKKFHVAKVSGEPSVEVWGSGFQKREFLYVDDAANACVLVMNMADHDYYNYTSDGSRFLNVGSGEVISIKNLAEMIARIVGYKGDIAFNDNMPDGPPEKSCDTSRLRSIGWQPTFKLENSLKLTYKNFLLS